MNPYDCIVIGGGASGLVSASLLAEAGRRVLLLEASGRLGGCVHTWRPAPDFWLELGAHTAYNSYGPLLEALARRGRLGELLTREKMGYQFADEEGRLQSPLARLSFLEAALRVPFGLTRPKAGRTVQEWFGGLLGSGNYQRLLGPAFAAVLSQSADNFPAEWLFRPKPRMKAAPRKFTFPGGLQGLLEALAQDAPFTTRTGVRVDAVQREAGGFAVTAAGERLTARQLVLATPVDVAAALLAESYPEAARRLHDYPMSTSEALGVVLPAARTSLRKVAGLIGAEEPFWSVVTRDPVPHAEYRGFTFHFRPGLLGQEAKLARIARLLGVTPGDFLHVESAVNRLPAPGVAHLARMAELDAQWTGEPVALVGNYLTGLSIGDCAERAAAEVQRLLSLPH
ncbi:MAG: FAD-dependent oxidoreductase [Betaproteobacteria bacterium]|nr:FAD-dependent oxidoreductase [Betaproteobacteria bacterium]